MLEFNIIEGFDLKAMGHNSSSYLHHLCEAKKLAFADRDRYVTDPEFFDIPVEKLLDKNYATKCRAFINANSALPNNISTGNPYGDTTYFAVVDEEQNMVSCIQSLYFPFGSGVVVEATGIIMQNRGAYFSLDPQHTNTLEPQKRTLHTLIASIVFDNEKQSLLGIWNDGRRWTATNPSNGDFQHFRLWYEHSNKQLSLPAGFMEMSLLRIRKCNSTSKEE